MVPRYFDFAESGVSNDAGTFALYLGSDVGLEGATQDANNELSKSKPSECVNLFMVNFSSLSDCADAGLEIVLGAFYLAVVTMPRG